MDASKCDQHVRKSVRHSLTSSRIQRIIPQNRSDRGMKDSVIFKLVETCITAEFCNILCMYIYIYIYINCFPCTQ